MPTKRAVVNAWEALFRAQVSVMRDLSAGFPNEDLTLVEYDVLFNLSKLPGSSARPRDLTPLLLVSQPSVSRMIDRLVERGLVTKSPDHSDGRGTLVTLTTAGHELFRQVAVEHSAAIAKRFGDRLNDAELAQLTELCNRLRSAD